MKAKAIVVRGQHLKNCWRIHVCTWSSQYFNLSCRCVQTKQASYLVKVVPGALRQGIATPVIQDIISVMMTPPEEFSEIPDDLQKATQLWHSDKDPQVWAFLSFYTILNTKASWDRTLLQLDPVWALLQEPIMSTIPTSLSQVRFTKRSEVMYDSTTISLKKDKSTPDLLLW